MVNIDHLFLCLLSVNTPQEENTAAAIPALLLDIDFDSLTFSHGTRTIFSLVPATAFLVLQELFTPDLIWCATGEATLAFGRMEGGPSERWEGGSAKVADAVLAVAFRRGSTSAQ